MKVSLGIPIVAMEGRYQTPAVSKPPWISSPFQECSSVSQIPNSQSLRDTEISGRPFAVRIPDGEQKSGSADFTVTEPSFGGPHFERQSVPRTDSGSIPHGWKFLCEQTNADLWFGILMPHQEACRGSDAEIKPLFERYDSNASIAMVCFV